MLNNLFSNPLLSVSLEMASTDTSNQSWNYCEDLVTDQTVCDECKGGLVDSKDPPSEVTREGTKFAQHFHKECPKRWCRKSFLWLQHQK